MTPELEIPLRVPGPDRRVLLAELQGKGEPSELTPELAEAELAYNLLLPRLRAVYREASRPWPEETEALVHDVRVASRRLAAALTLLGPVLDPRTVKRAKRRAKALRNALGVSREVDVMVGEFHRLAEAAELDERAVHALDMLVERGQHALRKAKEAHPPEQLLRHGVDVLVAALRPRSALTLRALAGPHLYDTVTRASALVETLTASDCPEEHHQLRIECKHVRYAVEILAPAFPEHLDGATLTEQMKAVQDALGILNDAQDLLHWLQGPLLADAVGAEAAARVVALAQAEREARYEAARDLVLPEGPLLFGDLRRAAGLISQLTVPGTRVA